MFCSNVLLILCTLIGLLSYAIHQHSSRSQHISVFTTCIFMSRQVCVIEPSFFNSTSGIHRHLYEDRHLVAKRDQYCIDNHLHPAIKLLDRDIQWYIHQEAQDQWRILLDSSDCATNLQCYWSFLHKLVDKRLSPPQSISSSQPPLREKPS